MNPGISAWTYLFPWNLIIYRFEKKNISLDLLFLIRQWSLIRFFYLGLISFMSHLISLKQKSDSVPTLKWLLLELGAIARPV
jgi:hypothetical protein